MASRREGSWDDRTCPWAGGGPSVSRAVVQRPRWQKAQHEHWVGRETGSLTRMGPRMEGAHYRCPGLTTGWRLNLGATR